MANSIIDRTLNATKWSVITELLAKCIAPVTSMILARILAPEAFGVLSTVSMVIAFAEVFVDSGFQKYLIQHAFENEEQERKYMSVAFWANLCFALVLWAMLAVFNTEIAILVGSPGKGHLIVIAGITVPIYSMIGIQNCRLRKELNFKKLFYVRIASVLVPLVVTIPLALLGLDYWALIIGYIAGVIVNLLVLIAVKAFKPMRYFSWDALMEMLSCGIWTLMNGLATWLTSWLDAFLIGRCLTDYYLGLYKNSVNLVTSIFTIVTAAITPVLFSSLSKLQDDDVMFKKVFLGVQRAISILLIPMGVGLVLYRGFATDLLLGAQWKEAADIIGVSSLTIALRAIFVGMNGDVFRAKGHFKTPLFLDVLDLAVNIPICYIALQHDFWTFVYVRAWLKLFLVVPESYYLRKMCNISPIAVLRNVWKYAFGSIVMCGVALLLQRVSMSFAWSAISIIVCAAAYGGVLCLFPGERKELLGYLKKWLNKVKQEAAHE